MIEISCWWVPRVFLVAGNRARAVRGSPFPHAAGSRRQNSGGLNLKHFHFVQKLSDTYDSYDTYEYLSRKRIRDYRCHKHTHMIEIHHDTSRCLFCQDMAHEFQAHFVWDVRENVLGGMTIHICPSVHPSRIHTIPLQYITSQSVYIYIIQYMYISSYIHTHAQTHTHTYCVLVGTCNTAVHKTPSQIILSGITLSPLIVLRGKAHETHQANQALWAGHRFQEGQKRAARLENCWRLDNYIST